MSHYASVYKNVPRRLGAECFCGVGPVEIINISMALMSCAKQSTLMCLDPGCHVLRSKFLYIRRLHEVPLDVLVLVVLLFLSWRRREASPWRVWCPCVAQTSLGNCEGEKDAHLGGRCKGICTACVRTKLSKSRSSSSSMFPPANGTGDNCVTSWNLPRNHVSKQTCRYDLPFAMSFDRWP